MSCCIIYFKIVLPFRKSLIWKLKRERIKLEIAPSHSVQNLLRKNSKEGRRWPLLLPPLIHHSCTGFFLFYVHIIKWSHRNNGIKTKPFSKNGTKSVGIQGWCVFLCFYTYYDSYLKKFKNSNRLHTGA